MASKAERYLRLAEETTEQITGSFQSWTAFLTTASRLYKYPFPEQLMIYAQRPDATACAEYDIWNRRANRYVRRGSRGIVLVDNSGDRPSLRYVFDIADTGGTRRPFLWQYRKEHQDTVSAMLENRFGAAPAPVLSQQLEEITARLAAEYWQDNQEDILRIVDGSFLEEYDDFNIGAQFRQAAAVSITYTLMARCGLEPGEVFDHEDFLPIFDFNTQATVTALGMAVSQSSERVLRQIEVTIKRYEREKLAERSQDHDEHDLHPERRLSDSRSDLGRGGDEAPGQVWEGAPDISEGAPPGAVGDTDSQRGAVPPSARDRGDSQPQAGPDDAGPDESGGGDGGPESQGPDDLGGPDEQLQGPGGGSDPSGANLQLSPDPEPTGQFTLFPSEAEQLQIITEAEGAPVVPFASSLSQDEIDHVLRLGSNEENARMRIVTEYIKQKTVPELTVFLREIYHGGYGYRDGSRSISSWVAEDGIHIARGNAARYIRTAQVISWEDTVKWIGELLEEGRFATNVELSEAPGLERRRVAESLWYMTHDMSEEARGQGYVPILREDLPVGFPDGVEQLETMLADAGTRQTIIDQLGSFAEAYRQDPSLMRFRLYRPDKVILPVAELSLPRREYPEGLAELPTVDPFITEDEIDAYFSSGSDFSGGRGRIFSFWQESHTPKEKANFLKREYGTGGRNNALSGSFHSREDYGFKGITLQKPGCNVVQFSWAKAVKRIDALMEKDRYLTPEEKTEWEQARTEKVAAVNEYNSIKEAHPDNIVLFQVGDFFEMYGEDARTAAKLLDFNLTSRNIPGVGRVELCAVPSHQLEFYLEKLRDTQDVVVAGIGTLDGKRAIREAPSIDHEAEQAIDAHEAEFAADGYRAFPGNRPQTEAQISPEPVQQEITQADIDRAIQAWNGSNQSKHAVVRHMEMHGREKQTAEWLAMEFNATTKPFHISVDGAEMDLSWPKVQRRIAQLIRKDEFFTEEEKDNFEDIDTAAIREQLERPGPSPFVQQVIADVERIAAESDDSSREPDPAPRPVKRTSRSRVERNYRALARQFPEFTSGEYRYLQLRSRNEDSGFMPLTLEWIAEDQISVSHFYELNGDLMYDPEMTFRVDRENGTLEPLTFRQDGALQLYQEVYPAPGRWIPKLRNELNAFADQWFKNIEEQGRIPFRAVAEINGEDVEYSFDEDGQSVPAGEMAERETTQAQESGETSSDMETGPTPDSRDAGAAVSTEARDFTPYHVGDTVYLENTAYEITAIGDFDVQLRDPAQRYPIFRAENRQQFEQNLYRDRRNLSITDFLAADPDNNSDYLREALTGDGGLLEQAQKEQISALLRNGESNARVASYLADAFSGSTKELTLPSGHTASLRADIHALDLHVNDQNGPVSLSRTSWDNIAPMLRGMYQQERDGFSHKPIISQHPPLPEETVRLLLQETLVGGSGMLELEDKERIAERIRAGNGDFEIAERLGLMFSGNSGTLVAADDTGIEYNATDRGITLKLSGPMVGEITYPWAELVPYFRGWYQQEQFGFLHEPANAEPSYHEETTAFYPGERNGLPFDVEIRTLRFDEPEHDPPTPTPPTAENFRINDDHLGEGGPKAKFRANMDAIYTLKTIENEGRSATPAEQETLSRYVGWGGLADAFDPDKREWSGEYKELQAALTPEEYTAARSSTLNAHYTTPTVIRAIYEAVSNMGFRTGNILEPSMGVGNFFGMLPEEMSASRLYGVELDSITGRIAQQLYPKANITVAGFETTDRRDFFDLAVGNVPFGNYQVNDRAYNKLGFTIHNYFFAKALDQVRPGGVVAFVTSRYTMDAKDPTVRKYLAQRADLLGAIRLPNNAFRANAGTEVVSDIIFLQKRESPLVVEPDWVHLGENEDGFAINSYFIDHPDMILGQPSSDSTQYGKQEFTVRPKEGAELSDLLHEAVRYIQGTYQEAELSDLGEGTEAREIIPADPDVKNFSFAVVDGEVYYRENSVMTKVDLNATAKERVKGLVALRDSVHALIDLQMDEYTSESEIKAAQEELNKLYDAFSAKYGLINDRANRLAFSDDSAYYLLCSLEVIDENGKLERKADFFTKRTIKQQHSVDHVDTASEALAVSIGEKARVDVPFMAQLTGKTSEEVISDLRGVIFKDPSSGDDPNSGWQTADEYLSGNVRQKLRTAQRATERDPAFQINVEALEKAQPKDLDASEIEVRLGATWIDPSYIQQFMEETFQPPFYLSHKIKVHYSPYTAEWQIEGKSIVGHNDVAAYTTYGTGRANAYRLLEESLNLRDIRIYDTIEDADGRERRVLNAKETTLAAQKQQAIREAFKDWIWKDPERRAALVKQYNEEMNSTRPREYDGSHLVFSGMNPEITLREHQRNAIAHVLYGGNTLLAHEVGAGKTFEMVAAAMESKRLGLCSKSMFVVPNHLVDQWASEFLRLYPAAKILVTTKKDFEKHNRQKFCARIATGDYDAVIIGHSQFEKIPISTERQSRLLEEQIEDITAGIDEIERANGERFTIKQLEKTKKSLEARLKKLEAEGKKDDVVTFEQLGVDRLFVDESDNYKNLFLYTKMRNVAGLSTSDAQKSSDMFAKCRYMDELTGGRGVVFATGTPVSNSMTELFTIQRYLQYDRLQELGMSHFDCWASRFGETVSALELAPEGTGYRMRTRFAKFFNLPELMNLFKEVADIKTADQLHLPTPEVAYHTYASKPTEIQQAYVKSLSERATQVHNGAVDATVDNMLKITSDGRKLGLDQRLIDPLLPDEEGTKVNQCVSNILQFWRDGEEEKLTQLVFCDISTPKAGAGKDTRKIVGDKLDSPEIHGLETAIPIDESTERPFTIYEDIRQKLIAGGMAPEQIAFIHDADTETKKRELFAKVRSGQVRVLIGSTQKMGAGTNVQDRLIALHDLDCPWRPRDLIQRKGRIERQGNQNSLVHVCRYVTEGTFDSYLWQTVEQKQRFISQIMTSKSPVRSCEDVDETALSFAEIKALCAGDPRIKERMDLDVDVSRLKVMKSDHQSKTFQLEDKLLKYYPERIEETKGFIKGFEADIETVARHPLPDKDHFVGMEILGQTFTDKEKAGAALLDACKQFSKTEPVAIGTYRGFTMSLSFDVWNSKHVLTLKDTMSHRVELGGDARGNLVRIENVLDKIPDRLAASKAQLENLYRQQEAAREEAGKPFPFERELAEKSARLIELDQALNLDGKARPSQEEQREIAKSERPSMLARLREGRTQTAPKPRRKPITAER